MTWFSLFFSLMAMTLGCAGFLFGVAGAVEARKARNALEKIEGRLTEMLVYMGRVQRKLDSQANFNDQIN